MYDGTSGTFGEQCRIADDKVAKKKRRHANGSFAHAVAPWLDACSKDGRGEPIPNLANAMVALRNDPALTDSFSYDQMQRAPILMRPIANERVNFEQRPVTDVDVSALQEQLQI